MKELSNLPVSRPDLSEVELRYATEAIRSSWISTYDKGLRSIWGIGTQPKAPWANAAQWLYCITVEQEFGRSRDELAAGLAQAGIDTRPFFIPIHELPPYARRGSEVDLPVTSRLAQSGLNLPTCSALTSTDIERICFTIASLRG